MSLTAKPAPLTELASPPAPGRAPIRAGRLWAATALAVALLAASGALRLWQGGLVDERMAQGKLPPFPLGELPTRVGHWEGVVEELDPQIARGTGSTDHTFRSYRDARTGVRLGVIILYGPAAEVFIHAPDNCYPAQGYTLAAGPDRRQVDLGDGTNALFDAAVYVKGQGARAERQEVYHSWLYGGQWTPALPVPKQAERIPGMLKVHISRPVAEGEFRGPDASPCEDFLAAMMPEIRRRLDAAEAAAARR